jgi:SAM-dependent methyltransferase
MHFFSEQRTLFNDIVVSEGFQVDGFLFVLACLQFFTGRRCGAASCRTQLGLSLSSKLKPKHYLSTIKASTVDPSAAHSFPASERQEKGEWAEVGGRSCKRIESGVGGRKKTWLRTLFFQGFDKFTVGLPPCLHGLFFLTVAAHLLVAYTPRTRSTFFWGEVVLCVYLFHELPPPIRRAAAREMARVLKPRGIVVFTDSVQVLYLRSQRLPITSLTVGYKSRSHRP